LSAASAYDASYATKEAPSFRSKSRAVYVHDLQDSEFYDAQEIDTALEPTYDIDVSVSTLQAYAHQQQARAKTGSGIFGATPSRMAREKWIRLSPEACQIWDQLDDHSKSVILAPVDKCPTNATCTINLHEITAYDYLLANMHSSTDPTSLDPHTEAATPISNPSPPESLDNHSQVLANAAKQTKSTQSPADIRQVLSNTMARPPGTIPQKQEEIVVNGKTYWQVHMHNIYSVSASRSSATQSLVDRGANGGIGGSDVRVIHKTHRSVDVQGINNHQMVNIPIATVGGVINTQRGEVIAILHQYAYTGLGTSIHSPAQLEWYKNDVNDRSIKVGGLQRITTLDGYVIPLNVVQGLPRMAIRPYTDREWEDLPHVILTSELDWDPGQLDLALDDDDNWFDAVSDLPADTFSSLFDEYGDYRHRVEVQATELVDSIEDIIDRCTYAAYSHSTVSDGPTTTPRTVTTKEKDYQALHPLFG